MTLPNRILVGFLLLLPSLSSANETHCKADESVAFSCSVGTKTVSVCVAGNESKHVQYRYGAIGATEISYPESSVGGNSDVNSGVLMFAAGEANYVRFTNKQYEYLVYEGEGRGWAQEGLVVLKDGKTVSSKQCEGPVASSFAAMPAVGADSPEVAFAKWEQVPIAGE